MAVLTYDPQATMRESRQRYFEVNGFGEDGGYSAKWVDFKFGNVPFPVPNSAARVKAVRYHDLHHILTGFDTDTAGEFEISGWELGAGCKSFVAAWVLNLGGLVAGTCWIPKRTFRAFVRGRRARSLYGLPLEELLDARVQDVRTKMGAVEEVTPRLSDYALFAATFVLGLAVGIPFLAVTLPLAPIGIVALKVAGRNHTSPRLPAVPPPREVPRRGGALLDS